MSYVVTTPTKGPRVLHRESCKAFTRRSKHLYLINGSAATIFPVREYTACPECIKGNHINLARAEAWMGHLLAARRELALRRERDAQAQAEMAARNRFLDQFEGMRWSVAEAWGGTITLQVWEDWNDQQSLRLNIGDFSTIYLNVLDHQVIVDSLNFSSGLIKSPDEAHRLSEAFTVISRWRSVEALRTLKECRA